MILAYVADPGNNMTLGTMSGTNGMTYAGPPPSLPLSRGIASTTAAPLYCMEADSSRQHQQHSHHQQPPFEPLTMMRAIHVENFGGPEVLQLKTNLIVPPLTKTQVLVRVKYAGVNPVETYIREGQYSR